MVLLFKHSRVLNGAPERLHAGCKSGQVLTEFMFAGVIRDLHDVELQAHVAFPYGVDAGDVGTLLCHGFHELQGEEDKL